MLLRLIATPKIQFSSLQRTRHYESKLDELRHELTRVKLEAGEAQASRTCAQEKEAAVKARLERTSEERDALRAQVSQLQVPPHNSSAINLVTLHQHSFATIPFQKASASVESETKNWKSKIEVLFMSILIFSLCTPLFRMFNVFSG